jgi:hypothetical protein
MSKLTDEQRAALTDELNRTHRILIEAGEGLTTSQWTWKAAPDRWSVAECLEHVALVEQLFTARLTRMATEPTDSEAAARVTGREELARQVGRSRETKRTAPEAARPSGRFASLDEFNAHFKPLRAGVIEFVQTCDAPLHEAVQAHPALGELSGHQWLILLNAHCERHAAQAREVRATPGFPPSDVAS